MIIFNKFRNKILNIILNEILIEEVCEVRIEEVSLIFRSKI